MNLKCIIDKNRFREIYSSNVSKINLINAISNMYRQIEKNNYADYEIFNMKISRYPAYSERMKRSWYIEHVKGTADYYISQLFYECLSILKHYEHLNERYSDIKIFDFSFDDFFNKDLNYICKAFKHMYEIKAIDRDFINAIESVLFNNKGSLFSPALKLLGFLCIISGNNNIDPTDYIAHYLQFVNSDETPYGNKKTQDNNKSVEGYVEI